MQTDLIQEMVGKCVAIENLETLRFCENHNLVYQFSIAA